MIKIKRLLPLLILSFMVSCNNDNSKSVTTDTEHEIEESVANEKGKMPSWDGTFALTDFYSTNSKLDRLATSIYNTLDEDTRAAQLIMPAMSKNDFALPPSQIKKLFKNKKIGGVLCLRGTTSFFKKHLKALNKLAERNDILPIMSSCDGEPALIHYKLKDQGKMVPANAQNTIADVKTEAAKVRSLMEQIGLNINFAPLADNDKNKAIIGNRSFGSSLGDISPKAIAFVNTHQQNNKVAVLKHFPGHGSVKGDSHKKLVEIRGRMTEVATFNDIIKKSKPLGVMVGHIAVVGNKKYNTNDQPASLSRKIVTDLLKNQLNFKGIVFTDAMNMGGVASFKNASYRSLQAGSDVIVMPLHPEKLHARIKKEIQTQSAMSKQLKESIKKIIKLKLCLGILSSD